MVNPHVLLIGGHGKISQYLTPLLLAKSWSVTSLIRDQAQSATIEKLGKDQPGKLKVLVRSLEDIKSEDDAGKILDEVSPEYVVWSAGAGGKGGPTRTFAIDRDAAIHTIRASLSRPSISTFLMVSYMGSRRVKPSWWDDSNWQATLDVNNGALANYHKAKLAADECLTKLAAERAKKDSKFRAINLRPGSLTEEPAGKVELGKTKAARGKVSREVVAQVAAALLEKEGASGWLDLLDGDEDVQSAVNRVVKEGVDCVEGEDVSAMQAQL